jgi:hypothetical protein
MTDRFDRIEKAFEDFRSKVEQCRDEANSNMADIQDAYNRLDILRNRYEYEAYKARSLNSAEREALQKVFDQYRFMEGMGKIRVIGHHVIGDLHLYDINNSPFDLAASTSGATIYANRRVSVTDTKGEIHVIDHLQSLTKQ